MLQEGSRHMHSSSGFTGDLLLPPLARSHKQRPESRSRGICIRVMKTSKHIINHEGTQMKDHVDLFGKWYLSSGPSSYLESRKLAIMSPHNYNGRSYDSTVYFQHKALKLIHLASETMNVSPCILCDLESRFARETKGVSIDSIPGRPPQSEPNEPGMSAFLPLVEPGNSSRFRSFRALAAHRAEGRPEPTWETQIGGGHFMSFTNSVCDVHFLTLFRKPTVGARQTHVTRIG